MNGFNPGKIIPVYSFFRICLFLELIKPQARLNELTIHQPSDTLIELESDCLLAVQPVHSSASLLSNYGAAFRDSRSTCTMPQMLNRVLSDHLQTE